MKVHAIQVHEFGGPEVMKWEEVEVGDPGPGQVRVRHKAVGLNYIEVYQRTGLYPNPFPVIPGGEASGIVEAVGPGVTHVKEGDRVAYASAKPGAYTQARVLDATPVVKLPDAIDFETAAAMMLKGLTAHYLLKRTLPAEGLAAGDHVLFHAAAGGVGVIAVQWAKALGLQLIATAGSEEKCALAKSLGAAHVINYRKEPFAPRVREITGGQGVKVVYDSVGKDTWEGSLDCLRPLGLMVTFGNASGPVPPFAPGVLSAKGSLYVTRPTLGTYNATRERAQAMADDLFDAVGRGLVKIRIDQRYRLQDVAKAHVDLEARRTTGSTVLTLD